MIRKHTVVGHRLLDVNPLYPHRAQCSCGEYCELPAETHKYQTKNKARAWHEEHKNIVSPLKVYVTTYKKPKTMLQIRKYWKIKQRESRARRKINLPD